MREDIVYGIFTDMVIKLKTYRGELLGTLIHQMETMQDRTSRNQERIRQIDKAIADLGAKNHVIARLHTSGAMNAADYAMQTSEISNRLTELRIERRQKLTEDEDDQLLATLKDLNGITESCGWRHTAAFPLSRRNSSTVMKIRWNTTPNASIPKTDGRLKVSTPTRASPAQA